MPTPVVIHVSCPRCGAEVPGLGPGQRKPCPYCKTELAMPRLDPTRVEMPQTVVADVATARPRGGCLALASLSVVGVILAAAVGAAVWAQQRAEADTARRVNATIEEVRRVQQTAFDQVNAAQREAERSVLDATRAQRQASCELRARTRCEHECRRRPAKCDECLPREMGVCASR